LLEVVDFLDAGDLAGGAEDFQARDHDILHGGDRGPQPFARVEFGFVFGKEAAHGGGGGQAQVGVDVHLAHAVADAFLDFLDRDAVSFLHFAAILVNQFEQVLRYGGGAVHHEVGIGQAAVDFADAADGKRVSRGGTAEFVGAVAGANGNGEGIDVGVGDKAGGFLGVGQHLVVAEDAFGANAVFFAGHAGLQGAQAADLAFDGDAAGMGQFDHFAGDFDVVVIIGRGLAVGAQGAVHHHGGEAELDGAL